MDNTQAARMLGWASIGIGLTEIAAPHLVERQLGVCECEHTTLLRAMGLREIASGLTILSQDGPTDTMAAGLWSRVAGDALDLALLGAAASRTRNPGGLAVATAMVLGITALDVLVARWVQDDRRQGSRDVPRRRSTLPYDAPVYSDLSPADRDRLATPI